MTLSSQAKLASAKIKDIAKDFKPKVGIVCGSGLGQLTDELTNKLTIPYFDLPGFPKVSVEGHIGNLILGYINDTAVVCLQGRSHTYEHGTYDDVKNYVRTLKLIGCEYFIATNASGSLREDVGPGELVMVTDHINFQGSNPLIGPNDDEFGPRFPPMDDVYNMDLQNQFREAASKQNINLHTGVYISVTGPSFETAAEIRAFKMWGADLVGMSTVPEVIVAHHCGLKVAVIATITNYATGLTSESHDHEMVIQNANLASRHLQTLIRQVVGEL